MSDNGGDSGGGGGGGGGWGDEGNNNYSNDNDNDNDNRDNNGNNHHDNSWRNNNDDYNTHNDQYYNDRQSNAQCCGKDWSTIPFGVKVLIAFLPLAIGFGAGFGTLANSMMKNSSWISVTGEVIGRNDCGCSKSSSSNNNNSYSCKSTYAAIVQYIVDGMTYTFTTSSCSNPGPTIGDDFKVLYDPSNPSEGVSGGFAALWLIPIIFIAIGLGGLALMCCTCFKKVAGSTPEVENTFGNNDTNAYDDGKVETFPSSTYVDPPPPTGPAYNNTTPATSVADEVPTNPYVTYAEENNIGTNTNAKPGSKPSFFDQMAGGH